MATIACGGTYNSALSNSIVFFNTAIHNVVHNSGGGIMDHCCTIPAPAGHANITNDPVFMNFAGGDYRLKAGSPCIDAGTNINLALNTDLPGNSRFLDGNGDGVTNIDIGAYEFDLWSTVGASWLTSHGLDPNDPLVFTYDTDHDGCTTLSEWMADTDPADPQSRFRIASVSPQPPTTIRVQSSAARVYTLWSKADLAGSWMPVPVAINVPGNGGLLDLTDANAAAQQFYRVSVSLP